jgi:hypothetical protein
MVGDHAIDLLVRRVDPSVKEGEAPNLLSTETSSKETVHA